MSAKVGPKETGSIIYPIQENKANGAGAPKKEEPKKEEGKVDASLFSFDKMSAALDAIKDKEPTYSQGKSGGVWRIRPIGTDRVAGACYDRTAKIWNFSTGQEGVVCGDTQFVLRGKRTGELLSLLMRDTTLITGSFRGKLQFWNSTTGALVKQGGEKEDHGTGFYSMADIGEGRIATGSCQRPAKHKGAWNHVVKIWNADLKIDCQLVGHTGGIPAIHSLGGDRIVSCSADKTMRIWDLSKKTASGVVQAHEDYVYCMGKVSNEQVLSGSRDRTIKLWDLTKGTQVSSLTMKKTEKTAHASTVYDLDVMGSCAVSGSRDGYVKVWDLRTSSCMKTLAPDDGFVYSVTHFSNGNVAAGTGGIVEQGRKDRDKAHVAVWDLRKA